MKADLEIRGKLARLDRLLEGQQNLLIVLHDNPDPDALASAYAFSYLAQKRYNIEAHIAFGGSAGRAENRAMVTELKIPVKRLNRLRHANYNRIAVLDTQPGAGNNSLPADVACQIVIDHHPRRPKIKAPFLMIDPHVGSTATIITQFLNASGLPIPTDLATALAYAIRSETQDLGRETTDQDVEAYFMVYPKASMRKLARIIRPKLPRSYFVLLAKALQQARVSRHLICAHLGDVPLPESVAEMADMLLRCQRISWSLCTGRYKKSLFLSMRSSNPKAKAGKIIQQLVPDQNNAGGHDTMAGGRIDLDDLQEDEITIFEIKLSQQFAKLMGYTNVDWKPLLED